MVILTPPQWLSSLRILCAHYFFSELKYKTRRGQVMCSSGKVQVVKPGRIGEYTGVNFFVYRSNFDMIYDIHKVKLSDFLLPNWYLSIRYRNQVDLFLNQNKMKYGSIRFRFTLTLLDRCISRVESITLHNHFFQKVY